MKITIIGKAPSVNGLYRIGKAGHIYLTEDGRIYKDMVSEKLDGLKVVLPDALKGIPLKVSYSFYFPELWYSSGSPVPMDTDNRIKVVQDAVSRALKFDDSWIFKLEAEKLVGQERAVVVIEPYLTTPQS